MEGPKFLSAFNFPGGKVTQGRRDVTNVPAQALALLNDPFVIQQADFWSKRLIKHRKDSMTARIQAMFQQALGRPPTAMEEKEFVYLVRELARLHQIQSEDVPANHLIWKDVSHVILNLKEFIYIP